MENRQLTAFMIALLFLQAFASLAFITASHAQTTPDVYIGIDISYGDVAEAKALIDQVSSFTNLIVIGTTKITWNPNKLNETFNYAYDKGLSFISLPPSLSDWNSSMFVSRSEWYAYAKNTWGDRLLGFYYLDEPGGRQLDRVQMWTGNLSSAQSTYAEAASRFTEVVSGNVEHSRRNAESYTAFTSDYALYWFDYKAGYDTVFAEFGWNYSRQLNIALCRGAAAVQNKDWGAMITWTYTVPPYIESGEELYNDLVLAYDNGAKYIIIFDGNEGWTQGILEPEEHLDALQRFWNYVQNNPRKSTPISDRAAYVLPNAYGFGFRGPNDHIWGLWEADALSSNVSLGVASMIDEYGEKFDIIYDDGLQPGNTYGYSQLLYWDSYTLPPPKISVLSPENTTYAVNNVTLTFTVNKPATWIGYSLDGQPQITITENITLYDLPDGSHNITLYAKDKFGAMGVSETIPFSIDLPDPPDPFPTIPLVIAAAVGASVVAGVGLLVYHKKRKQSPLISLA